MDLQNYCLLPENRDKPICRRYYALESTNDPPRSTTSRLLDAGKGGSGGGGGGGGGGSGGSGGKSRPTNNSAQIAKAKAMYDSLIQENFPPNDVLEYLGMGDTFTIAPDATTTVIIEITGKLTALQTSYTKLQAEQAESRVAKSRGLNRAPDVADELVETTADPVVNTTQVDAAKKAAADAAKAAQAKRAAASAGAETELLEAQTEAHKATMAREAAEKTANAEAIEATKVQEEQKLAAAAAAEQKAAAAKAALARAETLLEGVQRQTMLDKAIKDASFALSADEGRPIELTLSESYRDALLSDKTLTDGNLFVGKIKEFYNFEQSFLGGAVDAAQSMRSVYLDGVKAATTAVSDAQAAYDATKTKLDSLLATDPLSSDIAQLQDDLGVQKDTLFTKNAKLSDTLLQLKSSNGTLDAQLKTYNDTFSKLDAEWTPRVETADIPPSYTSAEDLAKTTISDGTEFLNSFPSVLKKNQTLTLDTYADQLYISDEQILGIKGSVTALKGNVAAKSRLLEKASMLPEDTPDLQLIKLQSMDLAKLNYSIANKALNTKIGELNTRILARNESVAWKTLDTWRPSTTTGEMSSMAESVSEVPTYEAQTQTLLTEYETTTDADFNTLNDTAKGLAQQIADERALIETSQSELAELKTNIPRDGAPRVNRMVRIRAKAARLANSIKEDLQPLVDKFQAARTSALRFAETANKSLSSVGSGVELQPVADVADVAEVDVFSDTAPFLRATARADQTVLTGLRYGTMLARETSEVMGVTYLMRALYSLKVPQGKYSLPTYERPIVGDSKLLSALGDSDVLQAAARIALPWLRVAGAIAGVAGIVLQVAGVALDVFQFVNNWETLWSNGQLPNNASFEISSNSDSDGANVMPSPTSSIATGWNDSFQTTSRQSYYEYYTAADSQAFQNAIASGQSGPEAYFSDQFQHFTNVPNGGNVQANRVEASLSRGMAPSINTFTPNFSSTMQSMAYWNFCVMYSKLQQDTKGIAAAQGISTADAANIAVQNLNTTLQTAKTDDRPLYLSRQVGVDADTFTYSVVQQFTDENTATLLAALKYHPEMLSGMSASSLSLFQLPADASDPNWVDSDEYATMTQNNSFYVAAQNSYQTTRNEAIALNTVKSYMSLLDQVPESDTDVKNYLRAQLQSILETPSISGNMTADQLAEYDQGTFTTDQINTMYTGVYQSPALLSFQAAWNAGVLTYVSIDEFTSHRRPTWFSVGTTGPYAELGGEMQSVWMDDTLSSSVSLLNQLAVYDFSRDFLGAQGNGNFNSKHTYQAHVYTSGEIETMVWQLTQWEANTDLTGAFNNSASVDDAYLYLSAMFNSYKSQLTRQQAVNPEAGAYSILLGKFKLAMDNPSLAFTAVRQYDPIIGNTVDSVGILQANSNQLAFYQALYLQNPNRWKGTPVSVLESIGLNTDLTTGELADGIDVGHGVTGATEWSDDQLQFYQTYLANQTQPGAVDGVADTTTTTDGVTADST